MQLLHPPPVTNHCSRASFYVHTPAHSKSQHVDMSTMYVAKAIFAQIQAMAASDALSDPTTAKQMIGDTM